MLPENEALWLTIDPYDALRMETATVEMEAVLGVFLIRLYKKLLQSWESGASAVPSIPRRGSQIVTKNDDRRGSELARELCETPVAIIKQPIPDNGTRLYELTRELCESSDMLESTVGNKFYRYLMYFVESVATGEGLSRSEAKARLDAAVGVICNSFGGGIDVEGFFPT